jgi:hypothetical protein
VDEFVFTSTGTFFWILGLSLPLAAVVIAAIVLAHKDDTPIAKEAFGIACVAGLCGVLLYSLYSGPLTVAVGRGFVVVRYPWPRSNRHVDVRELAHTLDDRVGSERQTPALTLELIGGERIECGAAQEDGVVAMAHQRIDEEYRRFAAKTAP